MRNLSQYIQQGEPATCENCGAAFGCGARLEGCWCAGVELSEAARGEMRARYERCLCRSCLERFAELDKGAVKESNG